MFNPHPYDDLTPVNRPVIEPSALDSIVFGYKQIVQYVALMLGKGSQVFAIDGCPTAEFDRFANSLGQTLRVAKKEAIFLDVASTYKGSEELAAQFSKNLPEDTVKDPVLLYGMLYKDTYHSVFDEKKLKVLLETIRIEKKRGSIIVLYGLGSASEDFWPLLDSVLFMDVTPKQIMLRAIAGMYTNLGDTEVRTLKMIQRRIYYIDLELAVQLRKALFGQKKMDYYFACDYDESSALLNQETLDCVLSSLADYPFRCKPVYIEGIWGGHYVRNVRKLPDVFKNIAWVFDLIPLEVSILVELGHHLVEIPFYTFVQKQGEKIMGKEITERFEGFFPIRFNYDDTFHSAGNMSIQCHPPKDFCIENFGEHGSQDEGYYIVATGHGAKTYCGFNNGVDPNKFMDLVMKSEKDKSVVPYDEYVHAIESVPGKQFLLPGGTIHASGRDQVILEIGSLTVGSYTFKLYDYLREDLDGKPRPIHSYYGKQVLATDRDADFVDRHLCKPAQLLEKGEGWEEYLVGEDPLVYYTCRQLVFDKRAEGNTNGKFHVIALVDGEKVTVRSKNNPSHCYHLNYLDIVIIPSSIGAYEIVNDGNQPVVIYKVLVRD
ncbi:class I mannose-6-phosphate isomerase [uncultured Sphaerochaeta sp.]|uniref:class I mannose-6-phosphate isomerase n=1 Tax=uncultured Sphaerochaeta sp. TaxID=886478 RepID=UPI002A0A8DBC|nr:class I mannose-6-phosphate isomerase [uncultured Sphaerochaeta sp.]